MTSQLALFYIAPSVEGIDARKVVASCCCDLIATSGTIRRPVEHGGAAWVCTGYSNAEADVYQVVALAEFDGDPTTYHEKVGRWDEGDKYPGDYARNDPRGFYHGMTVKQGGAKFVLCGPELSVPIPTGGIYDDLADDGRTRIGNTPDDEEDEDEDEEFAEEFEAA